MDGIFIKLDEYLNTLGIKSASFKQTGSIYQKTNSTLIDYYFYLNGYICFQELGYYIDFNKYNEDITSNYSSSRRRDYKYSLNNDFVFNN